MRLGKLEQEIAVKETKITERKSSSNPAQSEAITTEIVSQSLPPTQSNENAQVESGIANAPKINFPPRAEWKPQNILSSSRTRVEWEALIGGKVLNRIGAVAIILGIGFFLKYAFDNDLISPLWRVLIGVGVSGLMIGGGMRFHKKQLPIFAQGLIGAGVASLYISVYAAFKFYELVSLEAAFPLMMTVTVIAFLLAIKYDSLAISLLGWFGGNITPFILSTDSNNPIGLFTYIALLEAGMLAVLYIKNKWYIIEPLTLISTYFIYLAWFNLQKSIDHIGVIAIYPTIFWLMFLALDVYRALHGIRIYSLLRQIVSIANSVFYIDCMSSLIYHVYPERATVLLLMIAAIYFAMYYIINKNQPEQSRQTVIQYGITTFVLIAVATEMYFSDLNSAMAWSLEALLGLWLALRLNAQWLQKAALILFGFSVYRLLISGAALSYVPIENFRPLLNHRAIAFLVVCISFIAGNRLLRNKNNSNEKVGVTATESYIQQAFDYVWAFLLFVLFSAEVNDYFIQRQYYLFGEENSFRMNKLFSYSVGWLFYTSSLIWYGLKQNRSPLIYLGLFSLIVAFWFNIIYGVLFEPISLFIPFFNFRAFSFILLLIVIWLNIEWLKETVWNERIGKGIKIALQVAFAAILFILFTVEVTDLYRSKFILSDHSHEQNRTLSLIAIWSIFSMIMYGLGMWKKSFPLQVAAYGAAILAIGTSVIFSFRFDPIENFSPVLNYRVLVNMVLVATLIVMKTYRHTIIKGFEGTFSNGIGLTIIFLIAFLLTAEINDYFNRKLYFLSFVIGSQSRLATDNEQLMNGKQLGISTVWALYSIGLMMYGIWKRRQPVRLVAIGLFGITILKIFLFDLSFLTTLYRIFSFIGLGVILLLVSYVYQRYRAYIFDEPIS